MIDFGTRLRQTLNQINAKHVTATSVPATISPMSGIWSDPRSADLPDDTSEWCELMNLIAEHTELCEMLDTFRRAGTILVRGKAKYMLKPIIDETGRTGWESEQDYKDMTKHLMPWIGTIDAAMMQLHRRCGER